MLLGHLVKSQSQFGTQPLASFTAQHLFPSDPPVSPLTKQWEMGKLMYKKGRGEDNQRRELRFLISDLMITSLKYPSMHDSFKCSSIA